MYYTEPKAGGRGGGSQSDHEIEQTILGEACEQVNVTVIVMLVSVRGEWVMSAGDADHTSGICYGGGW